MPIECNDMDGVVLAFCSPRNKVNVFFVNNFLFCLLSIRIATLRMDFCSARKEHYNQMKITHKHKCATRNDFIAFIIIILLIKILLLIIIIIIILIIIKIIIIIIIIIKLSYCDFGCFHYCQS